MSRGRGSVAHGMPFAVRSISNTIQRTNMGFSISNNPILEIEINAKDDGNRRAFSKEIGEAFRSYGFHVQII
jgi:outer membrane lipoprotein SlyB